MQEIGSVSFVEQRYAGFWLRLAAWLIDALILRTPCLILAAILVLSTSLVIDQTSVLIINLGLVLIVFVTPALYGGIFESSKLQATPGKLLLKIKVTDTNGKRCGFARAFIRNLTFVVSDFTMGIGYLMLCWTKRKQCLHDKIANCLVLRVERNAQTS